MQEQVQTKQEETSPRGTREAAMDWLYVGSMDK